MWLIILQGGDKDYAYCVFDVDPGSNVSRSSRKGIFDRNLESEILTEVETTQFTIEQTRLDIGNTTSSLFCGNIGKPRGVDGTDSQRELVCQQLLSGVPSD